MLTDPQGFLWERESLLDEVFIKSPGKPKSVTMKETHAFASFGDNGTTASVNGYGNIMQITRYLKFGASGFVCVDSGYEEPYWVQGRMEDILNSSRDRGKGLRLDIVDWTAFQDAPLMGFMYDRWPRYIFNRKMPPNPPRKTQPATEMAASKTGTSSTQGMSGLEENLETAQGTAATTITANSSQATSPVKTTPETTRNTGEVEPSKIPRPGSAFPLSIQYFCCEGLIVQTYLLNLGDGAVPRDKVKWGSLLLDGGICIGGLTFVNDNSNRGKASMDFKLSDDRHKLLVVQPVPGDTEQSTEDKQQELSVAALIISPFINGVAAELDDDHRIELKEDIVGARLEISIVYTLKIFEQGTVDILKELKKPADLESVAKPTLDLAPAMAEVFKSESSFQRVYFAPSPRFDFAFRRNLEHILSVCSIPIYSDADADANAEKLPFGWSGLPIAITCGDIASHRVASRASLAVVQFLCSALKYLNPYSKHLRFRNRRAHLDSKKGFPTEKDTETSIPALFDVGQMAETETKLEQQYVKDLYSRVSRVLRGHIMWICLEAESCEDGTFAPHYWATGKRIQNVNYLPLPSLVDTPLQLLKVLHCSTNMRFNSAEYAWIEDKLRSKIRFWIEGLHRSNRRGTYAFSRGSTNGRPNYAFDIFGQDSKFSLTDHVMISMALECTETLLDFSNEHNVRQPSSDEPRCYYTSTEVRQKTLKRFTTEDPISKQRLLATSRWSDETRFLLHSKDTFLFSAANMHFFDEAKAEQKSWKRRFKPQTADAWRFADDRWAKLLDAQAYQDEFQLLEWRKPLWYMVVYVLGCKGCRLGNYSSEALIDVAHATLLGASWYNGLFPGTLGSNQKPACYGDERDRDNHWHATFETCNILWSCDTAHNATTIRLESGGSPAPNNFKDNSRLAQQAPKYVPFLNLSPPKDQLGRTVLSDDWLQSSPTLLSFESEPNRNSPGTSIDPEIDESEDGLNWPTLMNVQGLVDPSAKMGSPEDRVEWIVNMFPRKQKPGWEGIVIDVPRYSLGTELSNFSLDTKILTSLNKARSVWESKKRFIWLSHRNRDEAKKIIDCCSDVDKDNVLSFYERHLKSERFFLDSASAALNEWETELHLSYHSFSASEEKSLYHLKGHGHLASTTVSFRFSGDFSDRFWTCLLLEHQPSQQASQTLGRHLLPGPECGIRGDLDLLKAHEELGIEERREKREEDRPTKPWQQRRILELLIYSKMLAGIRENTSGILDAVKELALQSKKHPVEYEKGSEYNEFEGAIQEAKQLQWLGDREEYTSIARQWRRYIQILTVVEESLSDNIDKLEEWQRREQDRQDQQPRWTERDKRNHFTTILRLTIFTERQTSEIKRLRDKVKSFRESLPGQLESIREDINFRGSQSINLFTYVTVVFLPLGFATGVLSMNGLPDHSTSMNLVYTALAAFALTLFMLLNAEYVKGMAAPVAEVYRYLVYFICSLLGLRQSWQIVKYAVFYSVVKPTIAHRARQRRRKASKQAALARKFGNQRVPSSQPHHKPGEFGILDPGQSPPRKSGKQQLNKKQQSGFSGARSHDPESRVSPDAENHETGSKSSRGWSKIFKEIMKFSFREAVEDEEGKQEEVQPEESDKGNTSQQGSTSKTPDRLGHTSNMPMGNEDVEKGLRHRVTL